MIYYLYTNAEDIASIIVTATSGQFDIQVIPAIIRLAIAITL